MDALGVTHGVDAYSVLETSHVWRQDRIANMTSSVDSSKDLAVVRHLNHRKKHKRCLHSVAHGDKVALSGHHRAAFTRRPHMQQI